MVGGVRVVVGVGGVCWNVVKVLLVLERNGWGRCDAVLWLSSLLPNVIPIS